jgi:hypothetical protein
MAEDSPAGTVEVYAAELSWRCPDCERVMQTEEFSRTPIDLSPRGRRLFQVCPDGPARRLCQFVEDN